MFVSSYKTYLPVPSATKSEVPKAKEGTLSQEKNNTFSPLLSTQEPQQQKLQERTFQDSQQESPQQQKAPSSYTLLRQKEQNPELRSFSSMKKLQDAQNAYTASSQSTFAFLSKPKNALATTPSTAPSALPQEAKTAKESFLRAEMVNTYVENENYYRITAA